MDEFRQIIEMLALAENQERCRQCGLVIETIGQLCPARKEGIVYPLCVPAK